MQYEVINSFVRRLRKIGIQVELFSNTPFIYLDRVNGKKVQGKYYSDHAFTAFWGGIRIGQKASFTDMSKVFQKVRETLNS